MSKLKKLTFIIIGISAILFLFIVMLPGILNFLASDTGPINDRDLQLQKVSIAQEENAHYDLIKIENVYWPEGASDQLSGETWDEGFVKDILSQNKEVLDYFDEAVTKPKFQDPEFSDPAQFSYMAPLVPLSPWRNIARLSSLKALDLAKRGKETEALEEVIKSIEVGQKIQKSQAPLIYYLVATAIKSTGLEAMQNILRLSTRSSSGALIRYAKDVDKFKENEEGLIIAWKSEYLAQSHMIDFIVSGGAEATELILGGEGVDPSLFKKLKNNFYLQPNRTRALFAEYARSQIENTGKPCAFIETSDPKPLTPVSKIKLLVTENAIGKILHDMVMVGLGPVHTRRCEEDLLVSVTQLMFALKAYELDNGRLPDALGDLAPAYISSVSEDSFDGQQIKYLASKKILYSAGEDGVDSEGAGDDRVFELSSF